jgi:tryptophan synthase alpha subunit
VADPALELVGGDRLASAFARGRPALICYLPLGDPAGWDDLPELYVECGVDVLEFGVPGGDPYLDGKTISDSVRRARTAGVNLKRASELIAGHRAALPDAAMVWMTYPPDDPAGLPDAVAASGVDGLLPARTARWLGSSRCAASISSTFSSTIRSCATCRPRSRRAAAT